MIDFVTVKSLKCRRKRPFPGDQRHTDVQALRDDSTWQPPAAFLVLISREDQRPTSLFERHEITGFVKRLADDRPVADCRTLYP